MCEATYKILGKEYDVNINLDKLQATTDDYDFLQQFLDEDVRDGKITNEQQAVERIIYYMIENHDMCCDEFKINDATGTHEWTLEITILDEDGLRLAEYEKDYYVYAACECTVKDKCTHPWQITSQDHGADDELIDKEGIDDEDIEALVDKHIKDNYTFEGGRLPIIRVYDRHDNVIYVRYNHEVQIMGYNYKTGVTEYVGDDIDFCLTPQQEKMSHEDLAIDLENNLDGWVGNYWEEMKKNNDDIKYRLQIILNEEVVCERNFEYSKNKELS